MYSHGCDLAALKALLDHADYRQVQTYLAISDEQVIRTANKFALMDNLWGQTALGEREELCGNQATVDDGPR